MVDESAKESAAGSGVFGDARDDVVARAQLHGTKYEIKEVEYSHGNEMRVGKVLHLIIPNGRNERTLRIAPRVAPLLLGMNFTEMTILGDYVALLDRSVGSIVALYRSVSRFGGTLRSLTRLPGVEKIPTERAVEPIEDVDIDDEAVTFDGEIESASAIGPEDAWVLPIQMMNSNFRVSIRSESPELALADPRPWPASDVRPPRILGPSLIIESTDLLLRHDDAVSLLEKVATAVSFEMDLKYNIALNLMHSSSHGRRVGRRFSRYSGEFGVLENAYASEPVAMYFYGRSALGMPLLQYLAYYQAIEFFFPSFAESQVLNRIRLSLRDPRFNRESDAELQRIIQIARGSSRGGMSERDQLKATLEGSIEESDLEDFISDEEFMRDLGKDGGIKGVKWINRKSSDSLVMQVADRVYDIRCRIVHTKEVSTSGINVMLPFGREAESLDSDIALVRYLAQKVIISGSRGRL